MELYVPARLTDLANELSLGDVGFWNMWEAVTFYLTTLLNGYLSPVTKSVRILYKPILRSYGSAFFRDNV